MASLKLSGYLRGVFACIVLRLFAVSMRAQTGLGAVTGTVTDASNALVPDGQVALANTATGVARKGQSSAIGVYHFGAVPIGSYKFVVSKQGFEDWAGDFVLEVGQNEVLRVGGSKTVVKVSGAVAPIETASDSVADVKDSNRICDLHLNPRQIGLLFNLTTGVESRAGGACVKGMKGGSLWTASPRSTVSAAGSSPCSQGLKPSRSFALRPRARTPSSASRPRSSWPHGAAPTNCTVAPTNITVTTP